MVNEALANLVRIGQLKSERPARAEFEGLLRSGQRPPQARLTSRRRTAYRCDADPIYQLDTNRQMLIAGRARPIRVLVKLRKAAHNGINPYLRFHV